MKGDGGGWLPRLGRPRSPAAAGGPYHGRYFRRHASSESVNHSTTEQRRPRDTSTPCCRSNECAITSPCSHTRACHAQTSE
eukprot:3769412-Prymnesium_polylepis.2